MVVLMVALCAGADLSAHRRDEYLQAARISIQPARIGVEVDLTPGIAVADAIIAGIDRDRDGTISGAEKHAYAQDVLGAIQLQLDGRPLRPEPLTYAFPDVASMRRGEGTIRIQVSTLMPQIADGAHRVVFRNGFRPDVGVYLANALASLSDDVRIGAQSRDTMQRELMIDYIVRGGARRSPSAFWMIGVIVVLSAFLGARSMSMRPEE